MHVRMNSCPIPGFWQEGRIACGSDSDVGLQEDFQTPGRRGKETRAINLVRNKRNLSKGKHLKSEKTNYSMGENFCKSCDHQSVNIQNILTAHTTQFKNNINKAIKSGQKN